jgi:dihydropteroate synthase
MGVLNATPDSFYPQSRVSDISQAAAKAGQMIDEGADVLDIGGESTRPGAAPVSLSEELDRVLPVVEALHQRWPSQILSIDTQKAEVARRALASGAGLINDISALRQDPEMASVIADAGCAIVLMHMQGTPQTMQQDPRYDDVMDALKAFFEERLAAAARAGIAEEKIILDPGIGFGKTLEHNLTVLKKLSLLKTFGRPVLIGVSRKSFIGKIASPLSPLPTGEGEPPQAVGEASAPENRLPGTLAATLWALQQGAEGVRAHDVAATRRAIDTWRTLAA